MVRISTEPTAGLVQISADAQDVGSGSESLPATLVGDAMQIAFNVRYVLDGLKAMEAGSDCAAVQRPHHTCDPHPG